MNKPAFRTLTAHSAALGLTAAVGAQITPAPPKAPAAVEQRAQPASYQLSITGTCPGVVTLFWGGAPSSVTQALIIGDSPGSFTIPAGNPCAGTVLDIMGSVALVTPPGYFGTGPAGVGEISGTAGAAACGRWIQAIEGSLCMKSNPVEIP